MEDPKHVVKSYLTADDIKEIITIMNRGRGKTECPPNRKTIRLVLGDKSLNEYIIKQ